MKARYVQVEKAGAPLKLVTREVPEPGAGELRVRVEACGVCHSDSITVAGLFPSISYPRVPGHEIVGRVDSVGEDVPQWKAGQRVGIGWYGGHCGRCEPCRRGDLVACQNLLIPGITYDGGYADYVVAPAEALAAVPDSLKSVDAAPLLCAESQLSMRCAIPALPPDTTMELEGLATLECSLRRRWGSTQLPLRAALTKKSLHTISAPDITLTVPALMWLHRCKSWAAQE